MRPKTLSKQEEADLSRSYLSIWHKKKQSHAATWYEAVMTWLSWKYEGADIITRSVREAEIKIMQSDVHSQEYISALMKIVIPDDNESRFYTEHQKMMLLLGATSDEREQAILLIQS